MILERSAIKIAPVKVEKFGDTFALSLGVHKVILSKTQYQYWEMLKNGQTISQIVQVYLDQGKLVSFIEIYNLLEMLVKNNWVQAPGIDLYFNSSHSSVNAKMFGGSAVAPVTTATQAEVFQKIEKSLAFLRYAGPDLRKAFSQKAQVFDVATNTLLCKAGDATRDLFVIIKGKAGIYRQNHQGRRELLSTLSEGSVFGERSFFLNSPRTADVITLDRTQIAVFPFSKEFESQINHTKSVELLSRLRALQGILTSRLFLALPSEAIEAIAFSGNLYEVKAGQAIVREHEVGKSFFIIVEGGFVVTQNGQYLRNLGEGEVVGEVALMVSSGVRTATVEAQRRSIVLEISMSDFYQILGDNLFLAKEIESIAWKRFETAPTSN